VPFWWLYIEGHFSLGCHFHVHFSNPWHVFESHGLLAIAELLVTVRRCVARCMVFVIVCPSVWHTRGHVSTWFDLRSWFLHHMVAPSFYFWWYHVHPKIRRGSSRARALNEGGVGTNWRFSTNKPPYLWNGARYDNGYYWSLIGNRIRALKWPWTATLLYTPLHYTHVFRSQPWSNH